jgi:hypothetical protein
VPAKKPPAPGTLAALAECGRTIYIICKKCGRCKQADLLKLALEAGWRANVEEVPARLRCMCNHRGAKLSFEKPDVCPRCLRPFNLDKL